LATILASVLNGYDLADQLGNLGNQIRGYHVDDTGRVRASSGAIDAVVVIFLS
jgi:hypothetical protein